MGRNGGPEDGFRFVGEDRSRTRMMLLGTQRVNGEGHLEIGGVDTTWLAKEFGPPLYVMDEAAIRSIARSYLAAFRARYPRVEVSFAGKAFLCQGICPLVEQEGLCLDVASGGSSTPRCRRASR